jgi:hypothetical protein
MLHRVSLGGEFDMVQILFGFFFRRFNAPDALICYAGSIEKLKLLGATYLPKYCSG